MVYTIPECLIYIAIFAYLTDSYSILIFFISSSLNIVTIKMNISYFGIVCAICKLIYFHTVFPYYCYRFFTYGFPAACIDIKCVNCVYGRSAGC